MVIDTPFMRFHEEICPACGARTEKLTMSEIEIYSCYRCGMKYTPEVIIVSQQKDIIPVNS